MSKLCLGTVQFGMQYGINNYTGQPSYSVSAGKKTLRQAASDFLNDRYGLDFDPAEEIITTVGATEGLYTLLAAILNPDDKVLIPTPAYPVYAEMTRINGGHPVFIDVSEDEFVLTPDHLREIIATEDHIKAIIITNPSNPTGVTYTDRKSVV